MDKNWKYPHDLYMSAKFRAFNTNLNNFACFPHHFPVLLRWEGERGKGGGGFGGKGIITCNRARWPVGSAWIFFSVGGGGNLFATNKFNSPI